MPCLQENGQEAGWRDMGVQKMQQKIRIRHLPS